MFSLRYHIGRRSHGAGSVPTIAGAVQTSRLSAFARAGVLPLLLLTSLPCRVSAQGLGTMQVTARVLPGGPAWAGLHEAHALARQVLSSPVESPETRRAGLVHTRAEITSEGGRRRLLITVQYPHN
jgi:hypothetical protein